LADNTKLTNQSHVPADFELTFHPSCYKSDSDCAFS